MTTFVVKKKTAGGREMILCNDDLYRSFSWCGEDYITVGDQPECARTWKVRGFAERKANAVKGRVVDISGQSVAVWRRA